MRKEERKREQETLTARSLVMRLITLTILIELRRQDGGSYMYVCWQRLANISRPWLKLAGGSWKLFVYRHEEDGLSRCPEHFPGLTKNYRMQSSAVSQ
jgi:hypothetical protein